MVDSFENDTIALFIDTGQAHLARLMSGAPPVDFFVRDAGDQSPHMRLQDLDNHADRHWAPGRGEIHSPEVFRALANCISEPHLMVELRRKSDIPQDFAYLNSLGLVELARPSKAWLIRGAFAQSSNDPIGYRFKKLSKKLVRKL